MRRHNSLRSEKLAFQGQGRTLAESSLKRRDKREKKRLKKVRFK